MADNSKYIIEHEWPGTKFVLWAADSHLSHLSEWYLSRAGVGNLLLDLRALPDDSVSQRWASRQLIQQSSG